MMNTEGGGPDKLRDGPCSKPYSDLEACAADKKVRSHKVRAGSVVVNGLGVGCTIKLLCNSPSLVLLRYYHIILIVVAVRIQEKLLRCPRQTDVLIKCMKKNPLYFHAETRK